MHIHRFSYALNILAPTFVSIVQTRFGVHIFLFFASSKFMFDGRNFCEANKIEKFQFLASKCTAYVCGISTKLNGFRRCYQDGTIFQLNTFFV